MAQSPEHPDGHVHPQFPLVNNVAENEDRRPQLNETIASKKSNIPDTIVPGACDEAEADDDESVEETAEAVDSAVVFNHVSGNYFALEGSLAWEEFQQLEPLIPELQEFIIRKLAKRDREIPQSIQVHNSSGGSSMASSVQLPPLVDDMYGSNYDECVCAGGWMDGTQFHEAAGDLGGPWEMGEEEGIAVLPYPNELHGWTAEEGQEAYEEARMA